MSRAFVNVDNDQPKLKPHEAGKDRIHSSIASSLHNSAKLVFADDIARRANLSQS